MKKRLAVVAGLILSLASFGFAASGCHHRSSPEKRAEWITGKIASKLDLDDVQKGKLNAVKDAFLEVRKAEEPNRKASLEEVRTLILSEKLDSARVKALIEKRHGSFEKHYDKIFPKVADFHASLRPEQKKEAVELIDKFASHFEGND